MRQILVLLGAVMLVTGCATKNYVRQTIQPVQTKADQVADQANKQSAEIDQTRKDLDKNIVATDAANEKATAADSRAGDAISKANQADQKADRNSQGIGSLGQAVANLDNYKVVGQTTVLFGFNRATLTKDGKQQLDQIAANAASLKRYFIAIEGYTDQTGPADYNLALSKRRADAVIQYFVGQRDMDFNRVHVIGLGKQKLADTSRSREARAHNRRVEVKIYSADTALAAVSGLR
jgi:OmpA-OmpF porin, OOP family